MNQVCARPSRGRRQSGGGPKSCSNGIFSKFFGI